jgi:hypothetical protein
MSECALTYEPLPEWTCAEMEAVLERNDPRELALVPLVAGLTPPDRDWSLAICIRLTQHPDQITRGNALLGIGYLAHHCRHLPEVIVRPIIQRGMQDPDPWIRQRAGEAVEELSMWLEWQFSPDP